MQKYADKIEAQMQRYYHSLSEKDAPYIQEQHLSISTYAKLITYFSPKGVVA